ncbi:hypothetical protein RN001_007630 [Aquatica leii]|uniref:Uncharacterized protein n=1 Tax=Aquatica leii TaxID=1421715 RepID=A0AAN7PWL1_9COLE|nr:hypothetical protein RN001_007630 [Aquatica leii]
MGDQSKAPEKFIFQGNNISNDWKLWKQKFNFYLLASEKTKKSDEIKIAILLNCLSDEVYSAMTNLLERVTSYSLLQYFFNFILIFVKIDKNIILIM